MPTWPAPEVLELTDGLPLYRILLAPEASALRVTLANTSALEAPDTSTSVFSAINSKHLNSDAPEPWMETSLVSPRKVALLAPERPAFTLGAFKSSVILLAPLTSISIALVLTIRESLII